MCDRATATDSVLHSLSVRQFVIASCRVWNHEHVRDLFGVRVSDRGGTSTSLNTTDSITTQLFRYCRRNHCISDGRTNQKFRRDAHSSTFSTKITFFQWKVSPPKHMLFKRSQQPDFLVQVLDFTFYRTPPPDVNQIWNNLGIESDADCSLI